MRKSLIVFAVLAALSVGLFAAAVPALNGRETAVEITEERHCGDPAAAEGLRLGVKTNMEGYLHWDTDVELGPELSWTTDFRFTPSRTYEQRQSEPYLNLYDLSGVGSSTSYEGSINFDDWDDDPFGPIMADVASRAPRGQEDYTETVRLSDYMDYFPFGVDYFFEDGENIWYSEQDGPWPEASEFLHVPVGDATATVRISKNDNGGVYSTSWESTANSNLNSTSVCLSDGAYLAIWGGWDDNGVVQPLPEGAAETGVYDLPIGEGEPDEYGIIRAWVDHDHVELVWQPENGICTGLWALDGGEKLLAQVSTETGEEMAVVDTKTMEVEQTFPLDYDRDSWTQLYVEEDHVVTLTGRSEEQPDGEYKLVRQWVEAWYRGQDGKYEKTASCDILPADIEWNYDVTTWCDGERVVLAALADSYLNPSMDVVVCDGAGLQYAARINHSQSWDTNVQQRLDPGTQVTVQSVP